VIEYKCENPACGEQLEAEESQSGRPATCYKCGNIQNVPLPEFLPRVACPNCEEEISLTSEQAGKMVRCPKCGVTVRAPELPGQASGCMGLVGLMALLVGVGITWVTTSLLR
jgi:DNA-directed RNA polymerase subunit RPC12/RpoP